MLTPKQYELLAYIDTFLAQHGVSPSFDEMKEALNLKSKSGIHRLIVALEERGFIRRLPHLARALEVLRRPETMAESASKRDGMFAPRVIEGDFANELGGTSGRDGQDLVEMPLYGRIAAGVPIEALRDNTRSFAMPQSLLSSGEHYALEVEGDSMIDAGILDGDFVVAKVQHTAEDGDIVVAGIGDEEATIKTFRTDGPAVVLEPANPTMEPMRFAAGDVEIYGKLVTVMRKL